MLYKTIQIYINDINSHLYNLPCIVYVIMGFLYLLLFPSLYQINKAVSASARSITSRNGAKRVYNIDCTV